MAMIWTVLFIVIHSFGSVNSKDPVGHYKPLGSHLAPLGVTMNGKFSSPTVFYEYFVKDSQPLLMKAPLLDTPFPAFKLWTDEYLRDEYGSELVSIERSKKEKRGIQPLKMTLHEFLDIYQKENVYMVTSLPDSMKNDIHVPVTLQCGGFQQALQEVVFWMSSGGTKSVLHSDKLDNLLCLLNGTKDVLLIDKAYKSDVEADGFVEEGTYSQVDVDSVNLKQYPRLKHVPWHRAHMTAGDCLFIPFRWYHQINSTSSVDERNLAVNFWFSHLWWHNVSDCRGFEDFNVTEPLTKFPLTSTNEQIRSQVLEAFSNLDTVSREEFVSAFLSERGPVEELFTFISKEETLTWPDLYRFNIDEAVRKFPDVFAAGVKLPIGSVRKDTKETIHVQDDFPPEDNVFHVPMIEPTDEEMEQLMDKLAKQKDGTSEQNKEMKATGVDDSTLEIQDINVKVTKQSKENEKDERDTKKTKHKHDEF